jgi:hypothetical protein
LSGESISIKDVHAARKKSQFLCIAGRPAWTVERKTELSPSLAWIRVAMNDAGLALVLNSLLRASNRNIKRPLRTSEAEATATGLEKIPIPAYTPDLSSLSIKNGEWVLGVRGW